MTTPHTQHAPATDDELAELQGLLEHIDPTAATLAQLSFRAPTPQQVPTDLAMLQPQPPRHEFYGAGLPQHAPQPRIQPPVALPPSLASRSSAVAAGDSSVLGPAMLSTLAAAWGNPNPRARPGGASPELHPVWGAAAAAALPPPQQREATPLPQRELQLQSGGGGLPVAALTPLGGARPAIPPPGGAAEPPARAPRAATPTPQGLQTPVSSPRRQPRPAPGSPGTPGRPRHVGTQPPERVDPADRALCGLEPMDYAKLRSELLGSLGDAPGSSAAPRLGWVPDAAEQMETRQNAMMNAIWALVGFAAALVGAHEATSSHSGQLRTAAAEAQHSAAMAVIAAAGALCALAVALSAEGAPWAAAGAAAGLLCVALQAALQGRIGWVPPPQEGVPLWAAVGAPQRHLPRLPTCTQLQDLTTISYPMQPWRAYRACYSAPFWPVARAARMRRASNVWASERCLERAAL